MAQVSLCDQGPAVTPGGDTKPSLPGALQPKQSTGTRWLLGVLEHSLCSHEYGRSSLTLLPGEEPLCILPSQGGEGKEEDSSKDSSRKGISCQPECRLVLHKRVDLWHLPSRHQVLRLFPSHLEVFLVGFMSEVLKGW